MNVKDILKKHDFDYIIKQAIVLCDTHLSTYKNMKSVDFYEKNVMEMLRDFLQIFEDEFEKETSDYLGELFEILIEIQYKLFESSQKSNDISYNIKQIILNLTSISIIKRELKKGGLINAD